MQGTKEQSTNGAGRQANVTLCLSQGDERGNDLPPRCLHGPIAQGTLVPHFGPRPGCTLVPPPGGGSAKRNCPMNFGACFFPGLLSRVLRIRRPNHRARGTLRRSRNGRGMGGVSVDRILPCPCCFPGLCFETRKFPLLTGVNGAPVSRPESTYLVQSRNKLK